MSIEAVYDTKTPAEELNHFEEIADEYERTVKALNYTGPQLCIQVLKECEEKTGRFNKWDWRFLLSPS